MEVLALDVEATDLVKSRIKRLEFQPHVIQFAGALVDLDSGETRDEYAALVRPPRADLLTEKITKITRITWADLEKAELFSHHFARIKRLIEQAPAVAAHNLSYDRDMLDLEARRLDASIAWPERLVCTVEASTHASGFRLDLTNLHKLLLGRDFAEAHDARADVAALVRCLVEMRKRDWI
jgi:DNA polymerase III epsilon subunit-like protein